MLVPVGYEIKSGELVKIIEKKVKLIDENYYAVVTVDKNYVSTYVNNPKMQ